MTVFSVAQLPLQSNLDAVFGNPRGPGGSEVSRSWYAENIVRVPAPWRMSMGDIVIRELTVHRLMKDQLSTMLGAIGDAAGYSSSLDFAVPTEHQRAGLDKLRLWGMTSYGGGFNYRVKRSGSTLSTHAYGIAWDFDAPNNGFRDATPRFAQFPELVAVFRKFGVWGGDWSGNSCDGMHIQFARV